MPGMVAILTPTGGIDAVNDELVEYCGRTLEELQQWGTSDTVHPDDLPRVIQIFTQAIASGEPYDFEARLRRFDGAYRWFQDSWASPSGRERGHSPLVRPAHRHRRAQTHGGRAQAQ